MTIWHVQKLYTSEGSLYKVLPYDFIGTMHNTLKMKNGIQQMVEFMANSRLTENAAYLFCKKKNSQMLCRRNNLLD